MERLNVNPTRMMLTTLKKRLATSVRGHKLLKDKRDELMRQFLETVREAKLLRAQLEKELKSVYDNFLLASSVMPAESLDAALLAPKQEVYLEQTSKNIMSVEIPV